MNWPPIANPYYVDDAVVIYNADCRLILPQLPKVDLCLTDPPYGIGAGNVSFRSGTRRKDPEYIYGEWDTTTVSLSLINVIISMGTHSVIWGGNYYQLPPSRCWLVWDKETGDNTYADAELAWTNFDSVVKLIHKSWCGANAKDGSVRIHPTQKPIAVMKWCITLADNPRTILDPFMGFGTTLRAAKDLGRKAIGIEIEEKYCEIAAQRMAQEVLPL